MTYLPDQEARQWDMPIAILRTKQNMQAGAKHE